jgi:3-isopropylmalate dehydrogenase
MSHIYRHDLSAFENTPPAFSSRLTSVVPGWFDQKTPAMSHATDQAVIGVLPGEGIGPEVTAAAVEVLRAIETRIPQSFEIRYGGAIGTAVEETTGRPLTRQVVRFCKSVFAAGGAILCGAGGGRFVYDLRSQFDLFCKFTPVRPLPELLDAGVVRRAAREGVDLLIVRENVSGVYFGQACRELDPDGQEQIRHTFGYSAGEIVRILTVAVRLAQLRRGSLTLVVKRSGIPAISELWTDLFTELTEGAGIDTHLLEVDNAGYQLIAAAHNFDVVVAPNMLGDILSDVAALLMASRGMSYSGNFGNAGVAVYQTGHGAAYDLAGRNVANPIGQILSAAMLLRESFGLQQAAEVIETAVSQTVAEGICTQDIAVPGATVVGTREFAEYVARAVDRESAKIAIAS